MDEKTISDGVHSMDTFSQPTRVDPEFFQRLRRINNFIQRDPGLGQGPRLVYMLDEESFFVQLTNTTSVGRSEKATLTIKNDELSRVHFEVSQAADSFLVKDLSSKNGTQINDAKIEQQELVAGDIVRAGGLAFLFMVD